MCAVYLCPMHLSIANILMQSTAKPTNYWLRLRE